MPDRDEHLPDHEWKAKIAAEGRAIYIPGKPVEQMKAEAAAEASRQAEVSPRTIELSRSDWRALDTAIPDLIEAMGDVRNIFHDLSYQSDLDQPWVNSMMRLAARAITSMEGKELRVLDSLDEAIRRVPKGEAA